MGLQTPVAQHRVLSLMPTYRCTAQCKSCGTLSSPRSKGRLEADQVVRAIHQAKDAGVSLVVFTGGEATLELDSVLRGLEVATKLGMLTRLVTNAHWAIDDDRSDAMMRQLRAAGLDEINFSTGDQHSRFVPVENVLRAVRAALANDFTPAVMVETTAKRKVTKDFLVRHPYHLATVELFAGRLVKFNESPWMPLQPNKLERYPDGMAITNENVAAAPGCDSILQTITVQGDGKLGACCGLGMRLVPELNVGTIDDTTVSAAFEKADEDLLKRWIRAEGPERILAWAATKDPKIKWEGQYAHRCQACIRLYKDAAVRDVILRHYKEKVPDVIYHEYLMYHFNAEQEAHSATTENSAK